MLRNSQHGEFYFSYFWPLKPEYLFPSTLHTLLNSPDALQVFMGFWSIAMLVIATPVLTYFFGKRWYCSWVCGCGALAETAGDAFRHLSSKSNASWRLERWTIYPILGIITTVTAALWYFDVHPNTELQNYVTTANRIYGFVIGGLFSGVVGVGFYPILGSRIWCRFGCPMAAILGIIQKYVSRFRIETNGGQCISCGNCSTYCEMGIDVRAYAQEGRDIKRASCVGCGVCVSVCPRGVLRTR
jgi:polyferredoxin